MYICDMCTKRNACKYDTGIIYGGCATRYEPDADAIYKRLDNLEGCEDNPVYAAEIIKLRHALTEARP